MNTEVLAAYKQLRQLAKKGRQFSRDEIVTGMPEGIAPRNTYLTGKGCELNRLVPVRDDGGDFVDAALQLRILELKRGEKYPEFSLLLQTYLRWTTSGGDVHESFAKYDIRPAAAKALSGEAVQESCADHAAQILQFGAFWQRSFPGSEVQSRIPYVHLSPEMAVAEHYHISVIGGVQHVEPHMACMLSYDDLGEVRGKYLVRLYEWITQQPETASAQPDPAER